MANNKREKIVIPQGKDISIPQRPFIRLYLYPEVVKIIKEYYADRINDCFRKKLKNGDRLARNVLKDTASLAEEQMKKIATEGINYAPNAALTVAIKGFNQPLFKTGRMIKAIQGKVSKR